MKGFLVAHQKVSVSISLTGRVRGYTELTIVPTSADLRTVWLNARSLEVTSAALRVPASLPLAFSHLPPAPPALTEPNNIHTYPELKRSIWRATNEGEEGELGIALPPGCISKVQNPAGEGATPRDEAKKEDEWEQIVIVIEYEVTKPGDGIVVVGPDEANPSRLPHVFNSSYSSIAARTWVPCADHARERCTWDLELTVPRLLYTGSSSTAALAEEDMEVDAVAEEEDTEEQEWPVTVVASGELIEQVVHPDRSDRVIWHYMQASPVSVQQIAWAVGPFIITEIAPTSKERPAEMDEDEEEEVLDEGPKLHALCLPGREAEMEHSIGVVRQAMDYYTTTFGSYPFSTYTIAFVDALAAGTPTFHSAALTLYSSDLLHPPSIIDQAYETRHVLAHGLAVQWSGVNLIAKGTGDVWLVVGIALHITSLFLKSLWGNNEYRFRLKKDMMRCVAQDVQREPISVPARLVQPEPTQLQFIALKAPLVLHILDKHLRKSGTSLGLHKVLPKLFLDAITGEIGSSSAGPLFNNLTTNSFMRTCRKACGGSSDSLKTFFDQWIYGSGCPTFVITAMFNRKKMAVELNVRQECLANNWSQGSAAWEETSHLRPMPLFEGQMTIRIHEADGTPYEHVLSIQESFKKHEVPFNTKYKRIRRTTKRYMARQAAATAAASGDADAQEDIGMIDVGFSYGPWEENEKDREKWRVADWTDEDDAVMSQATYEWIRIDADLEWICDIRFEQPDFMWLSQLQRDRDVVAQLEAVHALSRMPSAIVASNLTKTVLVSNYFFRIRMEAALALILCATKAQNYLGLFHLFLLFQTRYCFEPEVDTRDPFGFRCIPKTNDFRDLTEYFLKKTLLTAISKVRDDQGQTPPVVQQFLVDLLAYNDNLGNPYSDTFYVTSVMNALGHALVSVSAREAGHLTEHDNHDEVNGNVYLQPAIQEIERYMSADRLVPSYHNAITVAGIEWKVKLTMASLIPEDRMAFFCYTRDGNYPPVRVAAFDALLLFNPIQDVLALVRYFFCVMRDDSSKLVQRRLAESLLLSLPVLAAVHDLAAPEMTFEEDGKKEKEKDALNNTLKALRKKPGRSMNYRQCLLQTLTHPEVDAQVRMCLLKICEVTVRPEGEPLPKMRFRVSAVAADSPLPVAAPSPLIPKFKLFNSGGSGSTPKVTLRPPMGPTTPRAMPEYFEPIEQPVFRLVDPPASPKKIKIKAPPKIEASQSSGMPMTDVASCKSLLKMLFKDKHSHMFRAPVDPVKSGAPGYFDVVTDPMDISTMSAKLLRGDYTDRYAFRSDFKLIVSNAILYNRVGIVVDLVLKLDSVFDKQWQRVEATLQRMGPKPTFSFAAAAPGPPPAPAPAPDPTPIVITLPYAPTPSPTVPAPLPAYVAAPAPVLAPAPPPTLPPIRLVSNAAPSTPDPAPSTSAPAPPPPLTTSLSFKLKLAGSSDTSPYATPVPEVVKPKGFKITLGGSSLLSTPTPKPPKAPKALHLSGDAEYGGGDSYRSSDGSGKHKSKKGKERAAFSYAEDDLAPPIPASYLEPYEPPADLPSMSKWINFDLPVDVKRAKSIMAKMRELPESFFFLLPVEPVGALATYYDEIRSPMDLQTMARRLEKGKYTTYRSLFGDFDKIVANCKQFNTPNTEPIWHVLVMEKAWRAEWKAASTLSYHTKRGLTSLIKAVKLHGASYPFRESINTIVHLIPTYFDVIERGTERDLGTISQNLANDVYASLEEVEADLNLMVENCFTFNPPENAVYGSGLEVQKMLKVGIAKIRAEAAGKKRSGDQAAGASHKKQKM